jgi:hypothetical protein
MAGPQPPKFNCRKLDCRMCQASWLLQVDRKVTGIEIHDEYKRIVEKRMKE